MTNNHAESLTANVLVVGAGAAGLRAALAAIESGASSVLILTNRPAKRGGASPSSVGACAVVEGSDDSPAEHANDTLRGGYGLSDRKVVEQFASQAAIRLLELEELGVNFDRTPDGKLISRQLPGHRHPRSLTVGMRTGEAIVDALYQSLCGHPGVKLIDNVIVGELIVNDGVVVGAIAASQTALITIFADAVVLATGGVHANYGSVSFPAPDLNGDGLALAIAAGAKLVDLEFVQYFPTALVWPPQLAGGIWIGELRYRCAAWLINSKGERFMERYDQEHIELATRDVVSRAIALEIAEGRGTPHGGVWLSAIHSDEESIQSFLNESFPGGTFKTDDLITNGLDIRKDALEVAPIVHFHMGGVMINENAETSVSGLFAAGEVAGGLHGANRIENNALSETQVFGAIAGERAAAFASLHEKRNQRRTFRNYEVCVPSNPAQITSRVQQIMGEDVGLLRHESGLTRAIAELRELRKESSLGKASRAAQDVRAAWRSRNATLVGEAVAIAANARQESRGAHYRLDYPDQNERDWLARVVITQSNDELVVSEERIA